jgi:hypothetical protein
MKLNELEFHDLLSIAEFTPIKTSHPNAWIGHLPFAYWLIKLAKPKIFVELGTHTGNSYFGFCQSVRDNKMSTKCYAVDTWSGDEHAGFYDDRVFEDVSRFNELNFSSFSRLMRMKFDSALDYFEDSSIELLHIDGLHTYEAVKHDFESWLPKLTSNAIVLFHDTNVRERGFAVWKLFDELKERYPLHFEFLHCNGLGVIQLGGNTASNKLASLFEVSSNQILIRNYFSSMGEKQLLAFSDRGQSYRLNEYQNTINEQGKLIKELENQLTTITANSAEQLAYQNHVIEALSNSTSMKITKPLRSISRLFRKI